MWPPSSERYGSWSPTNCEYLQRQREYSLFASLASTVIASKSCTFQLPFVL